MSERRANMATPSVFEAIRPTTPTVSVGVLTADLGPLASQVEIHECSGVKLAHFEVMDGCFCPMTTISPSIVGAVCTSLIKDAHLMITDSIDKITNYVKASADVITVYSVVEAR